MERKQKTEMDMDGRLEGSLESEGIVMTHTTDLFGGN